MDFVVPWVGLVFPGPKLAQGLAPGQAQLPYTSLYFGRRTVVELLLTRTNSGCTEIEPLKGEQGRNPTYPQPLIASLGSPTKTPAQRFPPQLVEATAEAG